MCDPLYTGDDCSQGTIVIVNKKHNHNAIRLKKNSGKYFFGLLNTSKQANVFQLFAHWTVDLTEFVPKEFAVAMTDGLAPCAIRDRVMSAATTMGNARTVPVSAHKDGTANIAQYVST